MPIKRGMPGFRDNPTPVAYEEVTGITNGAAKAFAAIPDKFDFAWIEVERGEIRIRLDGPAPTVTVGHLLEPGQSDVFGAKEVRGLQAIATTASNATLRATYYRELVA
jgi:hypothetical protein